MSINNKLLLAIPFFNEEKKIKSCLKQLSKKVSIGKKSVRDNFDIVFINDGSSDNSLKIINQFLKSRFTVLTHKKNMGYGAAVKTAFKYAKKKKKYRYFSIFPSDNQRKLNDVFIMLDRIKKKNLDYIVGSKFHILKSIPLQRKKGNIFFSILSKLWGNHTKDVLSGFKLYSVKKVIGKLIQNCPDNYSFDIVLNFYSNYKKIKFEEINVHCDYKHHSSKMTNLYIIFFKMIYDLFYSIKNLKYL